MREQTIQEREVAAMRYQAEQGMRYWLQEEKLRREVAEATAAWAAQRHLCSGRRSGTYPFYEAAGGLVRAFN